MSALGTATGSVERLAVYHHTSLHVFIPSHTSTLSPSDRGTSLDSPPPQLPLRQANSDAEWKDRLLKRTVLSLMLSYTPGIC